MSGAHRAPTGAAARSVHAPVPVRGAITGGGTFLGGVFHTLPFLLSSYHAAIAAAIAVVAVELVVLAWLRYTFFQTSFARSFVSVTLGGAIISALSAGLGIAAG